jgi:hypothetical protein
MSLVPEIPIRIRGNDGQRLALIWIAKHSPVIAGSV